MLCVVYSSRFFWLLYAFFAETSDLQKFQQKKLGALNLYSKSQQQNMT